MKLRLDRDLLDNATWHALTGPQRHLAEVHGQARRFRAEFARYSALPDDRDESAWRDLAALSGPGAEVVMTGAPVAPPPDWRVERVGHAVQLLAEDVDARPDDETVVLGPADGPEIAALIGRTQPGPWRSRTVELGLYLGIRRGGRLVAMAGQRLQVPGWTEVSAICTDEDQRRQGLAGRLTRAVVHAVRARGDEAFLHAAVTNTNAVRLYEHLGFRIRRETRLTVLRSPLGPDGP